jgi:hypothetical protein
VFAQRTANYLGQLFHTRRMGNQLGVLQAARVFEEPRVGAALGGRSWAVDGPRYRNPDAVSRSGLFPKFEEDALVAMIENEPVAQAK